jgi:hypothetical protein
LKTIAFVQGTLGIAVIAWLLIVNMVTGTDITLAASTDPTGPPGALKVVAWPWAEVYIDGAYVDTTPVARSFSLAPGIHEVTLKNPHFRTVTKRVLIESARPQKLKVTLRRKP